MRSCDKTKGTDTARDQYLKTFKIGYYRAKRDRNRSRLCEIYRKVAADYY